ncbi:MAG: hypothetical protein KF803_11520 [Cyclobacteriaceae bacterium]|nr:hypothetical protein [Cyclobacteriaceae bacterium]
MRLLIILTTFLLFSFCGQPSKQNESNNITINSDCDKIKKDFNKKIKEITVDKDGNEKLITDDFYNRYLKDIKEFKTRDEYVDLYYHSVPDIQTERCLVIIKSVFKYDLYSYSYKLVDLGPEPKVIFELAALEDYPDGQVRIKSIFADDKVLTKTKMTEQIGDQDKETDKYEIITDSVTFTYRLQDNEFVLTKRDSVRTIKK